MARAATDEAVEAPVAPIAPEASEPDGGRSEGRSPFSTSRVLAGAGLFLLLSAGGIGVLLRVGSADPGELVAAVAGARVGTLLLAAAAGATALLFGGTRIWLLARRARPGFRWRAGLRTHLYNAFFGGLTPAGTGGGPAQFLVLRQEGLSGAQSVAVLSATWVGALLGLVLMGAASALYLLAGGELFAVGGVFRGLLATVALAALGGLLFILSPERLERALLSGGRARQPLRSRIPRWRRRAIRAVGRYRRAVRVFAEEARGAWALNALSSWGIFVAKSIAGVWVLASLDIPASTLSAVARQLLQFGVIYFSPGPGGSGIAELSTLGFMVGVVPVALMGAYTVLWRGATSFLQIGVGGVVVAADVALRRIRARGSHQAIP